VIEILVLKEGKEFEAALHLRKRILAIWPDLSQSETDHIRVGNAAPENFKSLDEVFMALVEES
jgi:hypothetical protein